MNRAYAHIRARLGLPCGSSMLGWSPKQAWMDDKASMDEAESYAFTHREAEGHSDSGGNDFH